MDKNTVNFLQFSKVASERKAGNGSTKELIKLKRALKENGCYSKSAERMRLRCMIADNIDKIQSYISSDEAHTEKNSTYQFLVLHNLPTNPKKLKKIIKIIQKHDYHHSHKSKNDHRFNQKKFVAEQIDSNQFTDFATDCSLYNAFRRNLKKAT